MTARVLTALVGIPILLAAIWWGFPWTTLLVSIVAVLGIRELFRFYSSDEPATSLPLALGAVWVIAFVIGGQATSNLTGFLSVSAGIFLVGTFIALLWFIAFYHDRRLTAASAYLIGGSLYIGFLLAHALALRELGDGGDLGRGWLLLVLLVTFATDTGAFLVGKSVGRHPLAPSISPAKTWEGAIGGLGSALIASVGLGLLLDLNLAAWHYALVGAAVGLASQVGDLFESKLKRISHVKDAGSIIPGHGGMLDRLDSLLFSIPTVYYLVVGIFRV